jgi:hypothetical protein
MIDQYPPSNGVLTSLIWRKTAAGGETSLSGYDNASQALSYTPGQEQVYLNGILLVRGDDYTATNGTSITGLSALAANDFIQINCYNNFSVATLPATSITGTITGSQIDSTVIKTSGGQVITYSGSADALKITHTGGSGNSFVVEDSTSPDSTPFIIDATGNVGIGGTVNSNVKLGVLGGRLQARANSETYSIAVEYTSGAGQYYIGATNSLNPDMVFSNVGGTERLRITNDGRLQLPAGGVLEAPLTQNQQSGTSYTLVLADAGKLVELNNASAISLTVPLNSSVAFPVGTQIHLLQTGAGQVNVSGGGIALNATPGTKLRTQWSSATLIKRATDTWVLIGDLTA